MLLLERCRRANQDIEQLADRLMMMRDSQIHISQVLDGMPRASKKEDRMAMYVARMDALERELAERKETASLDRVFAVMVIDKALKYKAREREVLWRYYVLGMSVEEIAHMLVLSVSRIRNAKQDGINQVRQTEAEDIMLAAGFQPGEDGLNRDENTSNMG